ncbi:MAG: chromosomal replication initiator protein DnaA [Anaerovoracaceae bacterium]|jgi:chromosomal replication initiator protein|uniref:chromosomal replication initiator protein DnaA n=1 Tax=Sellimonas intestinalis TaxID=1653434 RepID=UPI003995FAD9
MMDYNKIWESVLDKIKEITTQISFETWFLPLKIRRIDQDLNIVYIEVNSDNRSEFIITTIKNRYLSTLETSFKEVLSDSFRVVLKDSDQYKSEEVKEEPKIKPKKQLLDKEKIFNPRFNFENFVVGNSNKYAHAAALAVAESPSEAYNPLFIYGGSGLGKTHLMHAIGIYLLENNPKLNVLYVSSEMFTNELIKALNTHKMNEFKSKYRKADVLLIDDIQFLEGKESTQEEFFHTFNSLYDSNKQIIISSDKAPNKLVNLEERLRSRFQWNLIADIQPADYETRVAILLKKAENMGINTDENPEIYDVACMIAEKIKDNIRELEGALIRVVSFSQLLNEKLDKNFTKRTLKDIFSNVERTVTPEKIKKTVCKYYGIKITDIESSKKTNNIAFPRQIAMYLIREMTDYSLPKIGQFFGGKHYTTVLYACEKIDDELSMDKNLREVIENIKEEIKD